MPRMSPMDRAFFLLETEQRPMNVGSLVVLQGRPNKRGRPSDELVRRMLRCPVGPPFNQRLAENTVAGWPAMVVDDSIDPAGQLFRHQLPAGSDLPALFDRVCQLHSRRLDRCRPLWEAHVFDGLSDDRIGLYFKTHHGLIDGIGFIRVVLNIVTSTRGSRRPQAMWRGLPPRKTGKGTAEPARAAGGWLQAGVAAGRTAGDLARLVWHLGRRDLGLGRGMATPFVGTPDVLKAPPSPNRVLGHCALPLERVRKVARRAEAKINDVLLATLDLAMTRYLTERGLRTDRPLVADMPVALHDDAGAGNRITILQVPMGRPDGTPAERLADIVRETRLVKEEVRSIGSDALFMYSILEHAVASAIESLNLGDLPMLANAVISNPAGLEGRVYFNGLPVELALPVSVVAHHQVLNVTITNYADELHVTFIALREAVPDVQRLADATMHALVDLERSVARGRGKTARAAAGHGTAPPARKSRQPSAAARAPRQPAASRTRH
jgi:diacylglycerol O-acyltransferase / wax synthase